MVRAPVPGSVGERLRDVREATRLKIEDFVPALNRVSRDLFGDAGPAFNGGRVSKLELGVQRASLDDIAVYAAIDPKRRGKLRLAWNETVDRSMAQPRQGPSVIQQPPEEIFDQPIPRRKKPGEKRA